MMGPGGPGYIQRYFDQATGQWMHTGVAGAHNSSPLRHLPPQAIMAQQQGMGYNHMEQFAMQQQQQQQQHTPDPPTPAPKTKKRTKKKKEKAPPVEAPMDSSVNLENFPPHLRFGGQQVPTSGDYQVNPPSGAQFEYNEHMRSMQMPGLPNSVTKRNSPLLKSPSTADMERPKSLNLNSISPSTNKSLPGTPNKGINSKNSSPRVKTEEFGGDVMDAQSQQKQALRIALEQRKQHQSQFLSQQQMMIPSNLHYPMNVAQFVQVRTTTSKFHDI